MFDAAPMDKWKSDFCGSEHCVSSIDCLDDDHSAVECGSGFAQFKFRFDGIRDSHVAEAFQFFWISDDLDRSRFVAAL